MTLLPGQSFAINTFTPLNLLIFSPFAHGDPKYGKNESVTYSHLSDNDNIPLMIITYSVTDESETKTANFAHEN